MSQIIAGGTGAGNFQEKSPRSFLINISISFSGKKL
jgi:hypothetical protein